MALEALWMLRMAHAAYLVWKILVSKSLLLRVDELGIKAEFMAIFLGIEIFGYSAAWFSFWVDTYVYFFIFSFMHMHMLRG